MASSQPITQSLLSRGRSPDTAARIFADRVDRRPVFLGTRSPPPTNARSARRIAREKDKARRKQRPRPLSARERRRRGLHDVPRKGQRYAEVFEPLHELWLGYVREVLGPDLFAPGGLGAAAKLSSADFHGAKVEVVRSSCPSRVGIAGVVVKDAKFAFEIVTPRNAVKVVPKEGTTFRFEVAPAPEGAEGKAGPKFGASAADADADAGGQGDAQAGQAKDGARPFVFDILGDQFLQRSADRANRKYKAHFLKKL